MGLDAVIFCDCIEKNRLKVPHPYPRLLYVSSNGSPEIRSKDSIKIEEHDKWMEIPPCQHESMMVDGCFLGNMALIERMRNALAAVSRRPPLPTFPVLLGRVIYSGTHTGDYLTIAQVRKLAMELQQLKSFHLRQVGVSSANLQAIMSVISKLDKLVRTSRKVRKPIAF